MGMPIDVASPWYICNTYTWMSMSFTTASANCLRSRAPYSPPPRVDHRLLSLPVTTRLPATAGDSTSRHRGRPLFPPFPFAIGWLPVTMCVHPFSFLLPWCSPPSGLSLLTFVDCLLSQVQPRLPAFAARLITASLLRRVSFDSPMKTIRGICAPFLEELTDGGQICRKE